MHFKTATSLSGLFYGAFSSVAAITLLSGCGALQAPEVLDESVSAASQSLYYVLAGQPDVSLTQDEIDALQYAANYLQFDNQGRALVVLGFDDGHSLQWVSANHEVVTTSLAGRVLRTDSLLNNLEHVANSEQEPLNCLQIALANEEAQQCPTQWQRVITTENDGHLAQWQVTSQFQFQDDGYERAITETGVAINSENIVEFENTFVLSLYNEVYRPVRSTQWVSPELGSVQQSEVKTYSIYLSNDMFNASFDRLNRSFDAESLSSDQVNPSNDRSFASPPQLTSQQLWIRVKTSDGNQIDVVTDGEPRLNEVLDAIPVSQSVMWPQTKITSSVLTRQFEAKKQGMYVRLKMLAQTFRYDGNDELAQKAEQLANDFISWPLKPSYVTNFSLGKARQDLAENPLLNLAQVADERRPGEPHYTILLSASYDASQLPLLPIADNELPVGFRDVNQQLRLFMQYWHFEPVNSSSNMHAAGMQ